MHPQGHSMSLRVTNVQKTTSCPSCGVRHLMLSRCQHSQTPWRQKWPAVCCWTRCTPKLSSTNPSFRDVHASTSCSWFCAPVGPSGRISSRKDLINFVAISHKASEHACRAYTLPCWMSMAKPKYRNKRGTHHTHHAEVPEAKGSLGVPGGISL